MSAPLHTSFTPASAPRDSAPGPAFAGPYQQPPPAVKSPSNQPPEISTIFVLAWSENFAQLPVPVGLLDGPRQRLTFASRGSGIHLWTDPSTHDIVAPNLQVGRCKQIHSKQLLRAWEDGCGVG